VNLLSTEVALKFLGGHQYYSGFFGQSTDSSIKGQVIEVTPSEGVFYDITYQFGPQKVSGSYLYYDSDNDNHFETIFVVVENNNVFDVGFDYDGDRYFVPNKMTGSTRQAVNKWALEFLKIKYGPKLAMKMYNEIWESRSNIVNQLKHNDLALYIESKGGRLITTEEEFNKKSAPPTHRIVKIEHDAEDGQIHTFYSRVNNFFYADQ
jgi:hypothetical protein